MVEMTLTAKGQFTFNKALMEHLGVKAGDKISVSKYPDGSLRISASKKRGDLMALAGVFKHSTDVKLSDNELNQAIADAYDASSHLRMSKPRAEGCFMRDFAQHGKLL